MGEISYRLHALQQMLDRGISRADVRHVIESGEVIEESRRTGRPWPRGCCLAGSMIGRCTCSLRTIPMGLTM